MTRRSIAAAIAVLVPLLVSCADDDDTSASTESGPVDTANDELFDFTSTITITEDGFVPQQAVAVFGETLTFVNETTLAHTITFTNGSPTIGGPRTMGPIDPGTSMDYAEQLESAISLVYESDGIPGVTGRLQIDPGIDEL